MSRKNECYVNGADCPFEHMLCEACPTSNPGFDKRKSVMFSDVDEEDYDDIFDDDCEDTYDIYDDDDEDNFDDEDDEDYEDGNLDEFDDFDDDCDEEDYDCGHTKKGWLD